MSNNECFLRIDAVGQYPEVAITREQYDELKAAHLVLEHALNLEEKYEILASNYYDLEREAAQVSLSNMIYRRFNYDRFGEIRVALNTRLVNILTAARMYLDSSSSHLKACHAGSDTASSQIRRLISEVYDTIFEYRLMEALRNHTQHVGPPVHIVTLQGGWVGESQNKMEFRTRFFARKDILAENMRFKKSVLRETPDKIDLAESVRVYIEALSNIHSNVRALLSDVVSQSRDAIQRSIDCYANAYSTTLALRAFSRNSGSGPIESFPLMLEWDDVRMALIKRNAELKNLSRRYISTATDNK